jgi:hypothetical protein
MSGEIYLERKTMHIDMSRRFYQKGDSAVAFKIIPGNMHKGMVISAKLKRELKKNLNISKDYPALYAICIYYLIKDELNRFLIT